MPAPQVSFVQPVFQAAGYLSVPLPFFSLGRTIVMKSGPSHKDVDSTTSLGQVSTPARLFLYRATGDSSAKEYAITTGTRHAIVWASMMPEWFQNRWFLGRTSSPARPKNPDH